MVMNHYDSACNRHPNPARGCAESVNWNLKGADFRMKVRLQILEGDLSPPRSSETVVGSMRCSGPFVAHKIWLRCCVSPRRLRANGMKRCEPQRCLRVHIYINVDLLQTPIHCAALLCLAQARASKNMCQNS